MASIESIATRIGRCHGAQEIVENTFEKTPLKNVNNTSKTRWKNVNIDGKTPLKNVIMNLLPCTFLFRRKIYDQMTRWKESLATKRQALIIKGPRQVGKTYIALRFAEDNYANVVYINFKINNSAKMAFEGDFDVNRITLDLSSMLPESKFIPFQTVIILDEIQDCAEARASLKYLVEDGRYDVICTGSLLGIKGYNRKPSRGVSVGFEHTLYMKAMDFEEFLWAKGVPEDVIGNVSDCVMNRKPVSPAIHDSMLRNFREYICIGGMPAAVDAFLSTSDMNAVQTVQRDILESYRDDFAKHRNEKGYEETDRPMLAKINSVFNSIPAQLAKENKKFQYSKLGKSARGNQYLPAIQWLCDYGLTAMCFRLNSMDRPLDGNCDESVFKLYFRDSGLFVSMLERESASAILRGDLGAYKGAIFENIIADAFTKNDRRLFYYARDSGMEIDFVTVIAGETTLVEVKATTGNTKSYKEVLSHPETYGIRRCIKFGECNIGDDGQMLTLPYYASFLLEKLDNAI